MYFFTGIFLEHCLVLNKYSFMTHTSFSYLSINNLPWCYLEQLNLWLAISYLVALLWVNSEKGSCSDLVIYNICSWDHELWALSLVLCCAPKELTLRKHICHSYITPSKRESKPLSHIPVEQRIDPLGLMWEERSNQNTRKPFFSGMDRPAQVRKETKFLPLCPQHTQSSFDYFPIFCRVMLYLKNSLSLPLSYVYIQMKIIIKYTDYCILQKM